MCRREDCEHFHLSPPDASLAADTLRDLQECSEMWELYEEFQQGLDENAEQDWISFRSPSQKLVRNFYNSSWTLKQIKHILSIICVCFPCRSKTHVFEEFLFAWHDRLRKLEEQTSMSVKLQKEVDRYKVT